MNYVEKNIPLSNLLLDPNNFRFQEMDDFTYADEARFHEPTVQHRAYVRLKQSEGLKALKQSIVRNTYVRSERIVVRPYDQLPNTYLVVEGNRRIAAAKWIMDDHETGAHISENVLNSISELPAVIIEGSDAEAQAVQASLMGIRHVSGIKQWGGYQRSKLIVWMRDQLSLNPNDIAERLAMTTTEVNRRYRAFKALQQYESDEEYGEYFKPSLYPLGSIWIPGT